MKKYALVIHGGAVTMKPGELSPEEEAAQREGLSQALEAGWEILHRGGSALDAVEAVVRSLEDNEHFNAGRGSGLTQQGEVKMDAAIMDGRTLNAGAVSAVPYVQNPISLARAVMDDSPHVCLAELGALELALEKGLPVRAPSYFLTEKTRQQWLEIVQQQGAEAMHDTVGAVALDQDGNLAVATSTGGIEGQLKGRVGDSPIIGGGTYASNDSCAISCTGDGEVIMRGALAHEVHALVKYKGLPLPEACQTAIGLRDDELKGDKGMIAIDKDGNIALEFNCNLMRRAYRVGEEEPVVAMWKDE
ncbi:isoaspartyl peptidase/L-asparaginase family protein [Hymenobacter properus]|uniref:Isoaspartyl peptidase n=1 Tax=Hymenobacter properus TaxID=2791026 RepID=A0A931BI83_9BACT|nr:isoaspartyl peptidase/L-asparaginase [Hymenobacter properus]MBF9144079.1 isoaspartyl peptidase/L-asparaginase [Hymenobacter properus]MBR7722895.1 isoaspartyl peptidase/L-asparaginase [Microvirga sp. SRT04]